VILAVVAAVVLGGQPAQLDGVDGWHEVEISAPDGPALAMRDDAGGVLAVSVAMAPNADAWRSAKRDAYEKAVIAGFAAEPGVKVKRATPSVVSGVPCIDLALVRDGAPVAVRVLLFRTRTVAIAVEGLRAADAAAIAHGLTPTHEVDPSR
jgi:hypothetical protein